MGTLKSIVLDFFFGRGGTKIPNSIKLRSYSVVLRVDLFGAEVELDPTLDKEHGFLLVLPLVMSVCQHVSPRPRTKAKTSLRLTN